MLTIRLAGHVAFFGFISEMKKPEDYPKALYLLQGLDTSLYLIAAVVIYYYGGPKVASPALGSTSLKVSQVAYGIAIPTVSDETRSARKTRSNKLLDHHRWCHQRSCRNQVHLRPNLARHWPHA